MKLNEWRRRAISLLMAVTKTPALEADLLLGYILDMSRADVLSRPEFGLNDEQVEGLDSLLNQRVEDRVPLAYITNTKQFMDINLYVDTRVLIPRPETESIVLAASNIANENGIQTVYEIGTGSGAIAIALAMRDKELKVVASDISEEALEVAKKNIEMHGLQDRIKLINSDLGSHLGKPRLIVANLPYLPNELKVSEEVKKEPGIALWSGADGFDHYKKILETEFQHLIIELGSNQYEPFKKWVFDHYPNTEISPVHGIDGSICGMVVVKEWQEN